MTQEKMYSIVQAQLATDLNCRVEDLNGEKDSLLFTLARDNPGRRRFLRGENHFEMLSMGKAIVVSATPKILELVKPQLMGKGREEAFCMSFIYGQSLYYLPDLARRETLAPPHGFDYEIVGQSEIPRLYPFEGFRNALQYDAHHLRPDALATLAKKDGRIVAIAGASADCAKMWQIGMDVLPECRGNGLGAYLVHWLTLEISKRGYIPYYGTAPSNIASQRVAHRAGYCPAWICAYQGKFDGYELLPTS